MRWLRAHFGADGTRREHERGAVAVITAVVTMFVAIAMLALSIDVGRITYERSQLQNGSDAAALALAGYCAKGDVANCVGNTSVNQLATLADKNANDDGRTDLNPATRTAADPAVCGHGSGSYTLANLLPCPSPTTSSTQLDNCLPLPSWANKLPYVEARTRTESSSGGTILPYFFAQSLTGGSSGTTQMTCSRAAWGPAGGASNTLPVTMGVCDWEKATANGTTWAPAPPYSVAPGTPAAPATLPPEVAAFTIGIFTHASGVSPNTSDPKCSGTPGANYPGGFGYLSAGTTCLATIQVGDIIVGNTGNAAPSGCKSGVLATWLGKQVAIPIFDSVVGSGTSGTYHISGIAYFYFAGYDNVSAAGPNTAAVYQEPLSICAGLTCNGSQSWLWGWFTTGLLPVGSINPNPDPSTDYGANIVVPAG